jgi:hypothetical protein
MRWFSMKEACPARARANGSPMTGHADAQHSLKSCPIERGCLPPQIGQ